jgi:hypothetical protein
MSALILCIGKLKLMFLRQQRGQPMSNSRGGGGCG